MSIPEIIGLIAFGVFGLCAAAFILWALFGDVDL